MVVCIIAKQQQKGRSNKKRQLKKKSERTVARNDRKIGVKISQWYSYVRLSENLSNTK